MGERGGSLRWEEEGDDGKKAEAKRRTCRRITYTVHFIIPLPHPIVIPLTWGSFTPALLQLPALTHILAADCLYDHRGA